MVWRASDDVEALELAAELCARLPDHGQETLPRLRRRRPGLVARMRGRVRMHGRKRTEDAPDPAENCLDNTVNMPRTYLERT